MDTKDEAASNADNSEQKVTIYLEWCKRCGNCVAFCPKSALAKDKWGYPYLAHPKRCTTCSLCEMLCPDFALSVDDKTPQPPRAQRRLEAAENDVSMNKSPERLAPEFVDKEKRDG